jgi:uncharacterized protein YndB with AHSA1/START domain
MATPTQSKATELVITRVFDAPRERVWQAWTDPELVKLWWGPEGFTAPSVRIDLRVGGKRIFAMHGPAGSAWDKDVYTAGIYQEIVPNQRLVVTEYMSDRDGNALAAADNGQAGAFPKEHTYSVLFEEMDKGKTKLSIVYPGPYTEEQYQAMLNSGMTEGWNGSLNKLAEALR